MDFGKPVCVSLPEFVYIPEFRLNRQHWAAGAEFVYTFDNRLNGQHLATLF